MSTIRENSKFEVDNVFNEWIGGGTKCSGNNNEWNEFRQWIECHK